MLEAPLEVLRCTADRPLPSVAGSGHVWQGETVQALLQGIVLEQAFDRMPILADALEEAGCEDALLLRHCRECPEHRPDCWALSEGLPKAPKRVKLPFTVNPPFPEPTPEEVRLHLARQRLETDPDPIILETDWNKTMWILIPVALIGLQFLLALCSGLLR